MIKLSKIILDFSFPFLLVTTIRLNLFFAVKCARMCTRGKYIRSWILNCFFNCLNYFNPVCTIEEIFQEEEKEEEEVVWKK